MLASDLALQVTARMGQGLVVTDSLGKLEYTNVAFGRMIGFEVEHLLNRNFLEFLNDTDREQYVKAQASGDAGEVSTLELCLQHNDGRSVFCLVTVSPRLHDGNIDGHIQVISNLSERKRIEEALERERDFIAAVLDTAASLVVVLDTHGKIVRVNRTVESLIDCGDVRGQSFERFVPAQDAAKAKEILQALREGQYPVEFESELLGQDGQHHLISWAVTALSDTKHGEAKLSHVIATGIDITERRLAEAATRTAQAETEGVSKAKGQFLANLSHELRTPLSAIIGFAQLLKSPNPASSISGLDATQLDYLTEIEQASQHILGLMTDVLDLSKIEAGRMELDLETIELVSLLEFCQGLFRERLAAGGLQMEILTDGLLRLKADPKKLKQVMLNLISNAVKFTPRGGRITLVSKRVGSETLELRVNDTGVGIAKEDMEKLFMPFTQVDRSLARRHEGTGLGLALSKQLIELHGGSIDVQSELGKGSSFIVRLPLHR